MARPATLLIDKIRSKAWINSFLAELQGLTGKCDKLSPSNANEVINQIFNREIHAPSELSTLIESYSDDFPEFTSQFNRWMSGTACVSSTHNFIKLFEFSNLVYTTGIPQSPSIYNVRIPDDDFATFNTEEKKEGQARVFEFYDTPPLWISIKGKPSEILQAWRDVSLRGWFFWDLENADDNFYGVDFSTHEWTKRNLPHHEGFLRDEIALADQLSLIPDHPVPPIVSLAAQIATTRLRKEKCFYFTPRLFEKQIQIELTPFGIQLDEIWEALDEVGCSPQLV